MSFMLSATTHGIASISDRNISKNVKKAAVVENNIWLNRIAYIGCDISIPRENCRRQADEIIPAKKSKKML